jgi:hypothetical protein
MSRYCNHQTQDGAPCANLVEDAHDHCAAGHPCPPAVSAASANAGSLAAPGAAFDMDDLLSAPPAPSEEEVLADLEASLGGVMADLHPNFHPDQAGPASAIAQHLALAAEYPAEREALRAAVAESSLSTGQIIEHIQACGEPPQWWPVLTELAQRDPKAEDRGLTELIDEAVDHGVPVRPIATTIAARSDCHPAVVKHFAQRCQLANVDFGPLAATCGDRLVHQSTLSYIVGMTWAGRDEEDAAYHVVNAMLTRTPDLRKDPDFWKVIWTSADVASRLKGGFGAGQKVVNGAVLAMNSEPGVGEG